MVLGNLLHVILGWFHFNAGVSSCIMSIPRTILPHLKGRWLVSVRSFLNYIHPAPTMPRQHLHHGSSARIQPYPC
jgi:hypothetical protein